MLSFYQDFENSKKEIEYYLKFIQKIEENALVLSVLKDSADDFIDLELPKILKANAFIMLYNLVEATVKNNLWEVFEDIKSNNVPYVGLRQEIKNVVLLRKAKFDFKTKDETVAAQVIQIIEKALSNFSEYFPKQKKSIYFESGNLDIDKINAAFKSYGLRPVSQNHKNQEEAFKVTVRNRNKLAHGDQTFGECGKDYSYLQLEIFKNDIFEYLDRTIIETEDFVTMKKYKKTIS